MTASDGHNIALTLERMAVRRPGAVALTEKDGRSMNLGRLADYCRQAAGRLSAAGIGPGDRVMLMVRPSAAFVGLTFALFRLGAVVILIDPGMGYRNLLRCIGRVRPAYLVGIPRAILFSRLFPRHFRSLRRRISIGPTPLARPLSLFSCQDPGPVFPARAEDPAAIIFTTGSTGPPKGVEYSHGIFSAQLTLIRELYGVGPGQVDQPAFPLFGLFSVALGARAVIPDMDPSRPARVDPARFVRSLVREGVTYSFGSPAIWRVVSRYCRKKGLVLPVQRVLMAGAPVSGDLVAQVARILEPGAEIQTPYGATEALPVTTITGREILDDCWSGTCRGAGVCVGRAVSGITLGIMQPVDGPVGDSSGIQWLGPGEIGEIVVRGSVVTRAYADDPGQTALAKIPDGEEVWHRMGDMGYLDEQQRLWFCGRKNHVVHTRTGPLYTICCEGIFNTVPGVLRSALVGLGRPGRQRPVLLVEKERGMDEKELLAALARTAQGQPMTREITTFLVHPAFPVDIRHNAKIFREKLAPWAARRLGGCEDGL